MSRIPWSSRAPSTVPPRASIGGQLSSGFGWPEKVRLGLAKFLAYMEKNFDNKMIRGRVNIRDVVWVVNASGP